METSTMNPPDGPGFASAVPASSDDAPAQGSAPNLGPLQPVASRSALNFEKIDATAKDVERTRSTAPADLETPELDARSSPFFPISLLLNYVPPGLRNFLSPNVIGVHTTYSQTLLLLGSSAASFLIGSVFGIRNPAGWAVFVGFWSWLVNTWYHNVNRNWNAVRAAVRREVGIQRLETELESTEWINLWLQRHWLKIEPWFGEQVTTIANALLDENRPVFLESLEISEFTLGAYAPRIESIKSFPTLGEDYVQYQLHLSFIPSLNTSPTLAETTKSSRIVLTAWVGKAGLRFPVPVLLSDISFETRLILRARLESGSPPNIRTLQIQLPDESSVKVGFVLKPLKSVDLLDLPGLRAFIDSLIETNVRTQLAAPGITIDVGKLLQPEPHINKDLAVGLLRIRVLRARGLKSREWLGGKGDPYVRVLLGPAGATRELARSRWIRQNPNPDWLELHHILIPGSAFSSPTEDLSDLIHFEVRDHNEFQGDALMGVTMPLRLSKWAALLPQTDGKQAGSTDETGNTKSSIDPPIDPDEEGQLREAWGTPLGGQSVWKRLHLPDHSTASDYGVLELQLAYFPIRDTTGERVEPAATKGSALQASAASAVPEEEGKVDPKEEVSKELGGSGAKEQETGGKKVETVKAEEVLDAAQSGQLDSLQEDEKSLKEEIMGGKRQIHTGILRVTLHQARNLDTNGPDEAHRNRSAARFLYEAAQKVVGGVTGILLSGPFTPYVIVRTEDGKVAWKSVRRRRTMNPLFEQTFELFVEDVRRARLHFVVKDATDFSSDPIVGECTVRIAEALNREANDDWYTLFNCDTGELRLSFAFIPIDLRRLMHKVHKIRRNVRLGLPAVADSETASSYSETEFESEMAALGEGGQLATEPSAADVTGEDDNPILHVTLAAARSLPSSIDAYVVVFVSEQREDESEDELVFRTKAAIRDPDPEFNDRFDLVIDEGMPKDARLVFEIRDRQTFVSPDEDPVVGRATVKLTSLKMNVKKEAWLSIHSSEGVFGLDRDAGVKVDLLLRPDDRVGDYVEEGPKDKEKFHLLGLESGEPSKEKRAMYEEKGGHGVQAGIKTLGRKVKKTAKDLATTPLNIISRSKPPFPPPPEHPNPDFSDPTAAPGSLLVRGAPSSVGRVKAAVTKSGIGAELAYWAHYLARGIVLPRHMRSGTVVLQCVSLGSLDRGVNVDQEIVVARQPHTYSSSGVPLHAPLKSGLSLTLPVATSEPAKICVTFKSSSGVLGSKSGIVNLDIREMIRTHPSGWESESDGATWTFHALIETPMNSELHAQGVMTVRFTPMDERTVRMKIAEERNKAKAPLSHLVAPSPSPSFSSSTKNSNSNSKSVVSDSPLVALGTAQSVGPPDLALQSAIERQIDYSI